MLSWENSCQLLFMLVFSSRGAEVEGVAVALARVLAPSWGVVACPWTVVEVASSPWEGVGHEDPLGLKKKKPSA